MHAGETGRETHTMNATGRREEQRADWRWAGSLKEQTGMQNARAEMQQELRQAGSQALIPLVGNNSRLIIILMQMPIFIQIM